MAWPSWNQARQVAIKRPDGVATLAALKPYAPTGTIARRRKVKVKMAACRYFGKFRIAVSAQRAIRYAFCLVLYRVGFSGSVDRMALFRLHYIKSKFAAGRHLGFRMAMSPLLSATAHSIHLWSSLR